MVVGGMLGIALLVMLITGGGVWFFYLREGAPYSVRLSCRCGFYAGVHADLFSWAPRVACSRRHRTRRFVAGGRSSRSCETSERAGTQGACNLCLYCKCHADVVVQYRALAGRVVARGTGRPRAPDHGQGALKPNLAARTDSTREPPAKRSQCNPTLLTRSARCIRRLSPLSRPGLLRLSSTTPP